MFQLSQKEINREGGKRLKTSEEEIKFEEQNFAPEVQKTWRL